MRKVLVLKMREALNLGDRLSVVPVGQADLFFHVSLQSKKFSGAKLWLAALCP
jgi:hypothetical protein